MASFLGHKVENVVDHDFGFTIDVSLDSNCGVFRRYHVGNNPETFGDPLGLMLWKPVPPGGCQYYNDQCCESNGGDDYACKATQCCRDFGDNPTANCMRGCLIKWDREKCARLSEPSLKCHMATEHWNTAETRG